jgi:hypothetical protein
LAIDPKNPTTIYAGTRAGNVFRDGAVRGAADGVFKSIDGGLTWFASNRGLVRPFIHALAVDPVNPSIVYAGTDLDGVFKSNDGAQTWTAINNGLFSPFTRVLTIDPANPLNVFVGTWGSGVFKTTNGGQNWINAGLQLEWIYSNSIAVDPANPATVYAGTAENGVFKSIDAGLSWPNTGLPILSIASPLVVKANSTTYCVGARWVVWVKNARADSSVQLLGTSNAQAWMVPNWRQTDPNGEFTEEGMFPLGSEGAHALQVNIAGILSRTVSFPVSNCY